jgi:nickel/cobalt exporter
MHTNSGDKNRSTQRGPRLVMLLSFLLLSVATTFAHPMGNFSVNHYSKINIRRKSIEVRYLIDMAEIPTFQEMRQFDITPKVDDPSASRYLERQEQTLKQGLSLDSDGKAVMLNTISRQVTFADGAGGLPTMKLAFVFRSELDGPTGARKLAYVDHNFSGRAGWKEIVVLGEGVTILNTTAPATDRSRELTNYSSDSLNSPPQQLTAQVSFSAVLSEPASAVSAGAALSRRTISQEKTITQRTTMPPLSVPQKQTRPLEALSSSPRHEQSHTNAVSALNGNQSPTARRASTNTPRSRFTELVSTQSKLSFWVLLSAALIAAGLGALHALEPGHGKTIVAAYLVGSRGTASHAVLLGIVVTAAHTAGVYLLGVVTLYASRYIVPEQLYPWLGAISGLSVAGLGSFIFLKHLTGETGDHPHAPGEQHSHWFLSIFKARTGTEPVKRAVISDGSKPAGPALSLRQLCMLGITGGIVPCPAALVVLLSAFSLHRIGFGLFLITAFSFGLAAVLVMVGLTMVYAKRMMSSRVRTGEAAVRYLPILSSGFMVVLGVGITASAIASASIWQGALFRGFSAADKLVPFATIVFLGLFLGMRHSTDADHVVAVSTIVSRQGSIRSSATIGLLWGLGHTLTIFLVGSAIVIFGVVIPPRVGLSMEFGVALMLILLGILNLSGAMRWLTELLTLANPAPVGVQAVPADNRARTYTMKNYTAVGRMERSFERTAGKLGMYQTLRPLVIGLVHGLAGSAAVALLVLSTIKDPFWSTAYLLVFGFGTMAGMMIMTAAISVPMVYTRKRFSNINRHLAAFSGLASVAFGMFLVYHIGFVDGLFTSQVHWTPQ